MKQHLSLHYTAVPAQPWDALERLWLPQLPPEKRARIARFRDAEDRNATLLGLALAALAFGTIAAPFDPAALLFPRGGKPRMPGGPDFSISHSRGVVACALASCGRVGLDLEPIATVRASTAARVLSPSELKAIARGQITPTDAWVMKEAVVKAAGRGVGSLPSVRLDGRRASLGEADFWLRPVEGIPRYVTWLACEWRGARVQVREIPVSAFAPLPGTR